MVQTEHILTLAFAYADALGIPLVTVSSRVFGDSKKLAAIEMGKDITVRRFGAAVQWFADHWPDNAEWPADVPRPEPHRNGAAA